MLPHSIYKIVLKNRVITLNKEYISGIEYDALNKTGKLTIHCDRKGYTISQSDCLAGNSPLKEHDRLLAEFANDHEQMMAVHKQKIAAMSNRKPAAKEEKKKKEEKKPAKKKAEKKEG